MRHISIYWEKDSNDLVALYQDLGNIGETCGNDGAELAVTESELTLIRDYIADKSSKFILEVYNTDEATLQEYIAAWRKMAHG